jgi:N-acetylglucosaminyl-diphospho-decaprenol L-rhamnosyltransferase
MRLKDSLNTSQPEISACIIAYKRKAALLECIQALKETIKSCPYEILVCDNCSEDGTAETLLVQYPDVRTLTNSTNVGFSAANNQLMCAGRGRLFLILNNDCLVTEGAVDAMRRFLADHPEAAIVGPRILLPDGILQPSFQRELETPFANYTLTRLSHAKRQERILASCGHLALRRTVMQQYVAEQGYDRVQEVAVVIGACMLVRREFVEQCGGLDERYFMYREDTDWCLRARQAGWKVFYYPAATIYHNHIHRKARNVEFDEILTPAYYESQLIFCETYFSRLTTIRLGLLLAGITLARMFRDVLLLAFSRALARRRLQRQSDLLKRLLSYAFRRRINRRPVFENQIARDPGILEPGGKA